MVIGVKPEFGKLELMLEPVVDAVSDSASLVTGIASRLGVCDRVVSRISQLYSNPLGALEKRTERVLKNFRQDIRM